MANMNMVETGRESADIARVEQHEIAEGVSLVGIGIIKTLAALVGVWGLACLIGGLSKGGSIMAVAQGWLSAITGM